MVFHTPPKYQETEPSIAELCKFTIREIMQTYDTVYKTARTDLLHLTELGYLIKQKRGREFIFIFNENSDCFLIIMMESPAGERHLYGVLLRLASHPIAVFRSCPVGRMTPMTCRNAPGANGCSRPDLTPCFTLCSSLLIALIPNAQ